MIVTRGFTMMNTLILSGYGFEYPMGVQEDVVVIIPEVQITFIDHEEPIEIKEKK